MTSPASPERLPLSSPDLAAERLARLRELLPGAFAEGKLVPGKLAELVGAAALSATPERYGLSYAGRAEALREMLAPTPGTLRPDREKSVAWDATENLILEGDNLHVLKLLQSAYAGAVKLIYIDPPYNTGNDFVYPDDFRAGVRHYKELTQQTLSTNAETSGRYHSDWLKMMHPRLALARNLLRDDGVIFVSIDDHEVHNLRLLMDEVFGEENFIEGFIWKKSYGGGAKERFAVRQHEHCLLYARDMGNVDEFWLPSDPEIEKRYYKFTDRHEETKGPFRIKPLEATKSMDTRTNLVYPIPAPDGTEVWPKRQWWWSRERTMKTLADDGLVFTKTTEGYSVSYKQYLRTADGEKRGSKPFSIIENFYTQQGTDELRKLFNDEVVVQFPKPVGLIQRIIQIGSDENDLILDFFAGSGTTAQAVLELNRQDGGNRKFILVQFPEPTGRADFPTIADITRERVRRVIARRPADLASGAPEGFRAYRLDDSNFKLWDGDAVLADAAALAKQLELIAHNVLDGRSDEDVLAELLLKCGHPGVTLTSAVETREVAGTPVHLLAEGRLALCLARALTPEVLRGIAALQPQRVLCLDVGFHGNDQLKTNTVLEMKSHGIQFQTV